MTRGPVHEAFAQPINTGKVETLIVNKKPPPDIAEIPPDAKPADEDAIWIPGYWAWDDDSRDFLWVSGIWRVPPPGEQWVSGYWNQVWGGYQWVPGFWSPANIQEVEYYPEPPASLERGPTSDPPSADEFWVSGCWRWHESRYVWQPGYWAPIRDGWVWQAASYYSSPRGWIFNVGFWDYPLLDRGLIFAPVRFTTDEYLRPNYVYSPSVVIDAGPLSFYLFTRPNYCHYYFGDYYARSYDRLGIYPWFDVGRDRHYAYDPLFSYYRWHYGSRDPRWLDNLRGWNSFYREHADQRPPRTFAAEQQLIARGETRTDRQFLRIAETVDNLRKDTNAPIRLAAVPPDQKTRIQTTARELNTFRAERAKAEMRAPVSALAAPEKATEKVAPLMPKAPEKAALPKLPSIQMGTTINEERRARINPPPTPARSETQVTPSVPQVPGRPESRITAPVPRPSAGEQREKAESRRGGNFVPAPPNAPGTMPNRNLVPEQVPKRESVPLPRTEKPQAGRNIPSRPRPPETKSVNKAPELRQTPPRREPSPQPPQVIREARKPINPPQPPPRVENPQRPPAPAEKAPPPQREKVPPPQREKSPPPEKAPPPKDKIPPRS
jgi:hypothetical protein